MSTESRNTTARTVEVAGSVSTSDTGACVKSAKGVVYVHINGLKTIAKNVMVLESANTVSAVFDVLTVKVVPFVPIKN